MTTSKFKTVQLLAEFERDLKKLSRRFRSLADDLKTFVEAGLFSYHKLKIDNKGIFHIPDLGFSTPRVFKAKKFACKALKGSGINSGIRVIYAYYENEDKIEFIELYYKGDKDNEDKARIIRKYA